MTFPSTTLVLVSCIECSPLRGNNVTLVLKYRAMGSYTKVPVHSSPSCMGPSLSGRPSGLYPVQLLRVGRERNGPKSSYKRVLSSALTVQQLHLSTSTHYDLLCNVSRRNRRPVLQVHQRVQFRWTRKSLCWKIHP